jgi:hypothetical protein
MPDAIYAPEGRRVYSTNGDAQLNLIDASRHDPFASHKQREIYRGYYDQLAADRVKLNDQLTNFYSTTEKLLGTAIGTYGIYGSLIKSRRKWLRPADNLVQRISSQDEERQLASLSNQMKSLSAPGHAKAAAALSKQTQIIEANIMLRSRLHALGGLGLGLGAAHLTDRLFFSHDTVGDGSMFADLLACPLLAWRVPGNFAMKAAAVAAASIAGKVFDHMTQPRYVFNPRQEMQSSDTLIGRHGMFVGAGEGPILNTGLERPLMIITAPGSTPLPASMFTPEDRRNQILNRNMQQKETFYKAPGQ